MNIFNATLKNVRLCIPQSVEALSRNAKRPRVNTRGRIF